jgi:hypothetical protein
MKKEPRIRNFLHGLAAQILIIADISVKYLVKIKGHLQWKTLDNL